MDNTQIPQVTSHKHLGIHFSDTLSWQKHIDKVYTSMIMRPTSGHDPTSEIEIFACCPEKDLYRRSPA